jgi:hypothetical protein
MQYEIRAMSFAEILDTALRLVSNHFVLLVGLMACAHVPAVLAGAYLEPNTAFGQTRPSEAIVMLLLYPIAFAAAMYAIGRLYRGHQVGFREALDFVASHLMQLMGTSLLSGLFIGLGFICLIIPGLYLSLALTAVLPIMVVEQLYGMKAIYRSRELLTDNMLRAAGVLFVVWIITMVLGGAAMLALAFIPVVGTIGGALVQSVIAAYTASAQMVLYLEIRCRKEGFDIEHLAERVELTGETGVAGA